MRCWICLMSWLLWLRFSQFIFVHCTPHLKWLNVPRAASHLHYAATSSKDPAFCPRQSHVHLHFNVAVLRATCPATLKLMLSLLFTNMRPSLVVVSCWILITSPIAALDASVSFIHSAIYSIVYCDFKNRYRKKFIENPRLPVPLRHLLG